jgi:ceramide glucosyltransferase
MPQTLLAIALCSLAVTLLFNACVLLTRARRRPDLGVRPPVSILKPLAGLDDELFENLASIARQRYPRFEIVLGAESPRDPALGVAERLRRTYPDVDIRIVYGTPELGMNPKVRNLAELARAARYDWILVSDSNIRADPNYLAAMAAELSDPRVGLVHSLIKGGGERSTGSIFESMALTTWVASAVCGAGVLGGHPCVVGKSML